MAQPPHTIRAVIFDLDDTLYPERDFAFSGFKAVAAALKALLGDPEESLLEMKALFDTPHRSCVFNELLRRRNLADDELTVTKMVEVYRNHEPTLSLYPDARAALDRLRPRLKLGLITDGFEATQRGKIKALGLENQLDEIVLTDGCGREFWKPHPRSFDETARRLGLVNHELVYVADNSAKDFVAPRSLGWLTVRIIREDGIYRDAAPAPEGKPHHTIFSLDELDALIKQEA